MIDTTKLKDVELDLTHSNQAKQNRPVECLGKTFANDEERRQYYLDILANKLKDPEFRKIDGFPIGEDEDILNLSDPPYFTACPNPFIQDFINVYGRLYDTNEKYKREPYAADVSEGKNDPIYTAHSYHTKVPHKAIMRYILHYTNPGDVVLDGFCGTGMTGVAAQLCGDKATVESLGYRVEQSRSIFQEIYDKSTGKAEWVEFSKLGVRNVILNDLSPAATFIAQNYNSPIDIKIFEDEANKIIDKVYKDCSWMYQTLHADGKSKGTINYTLWSDVFVCPECGNDVIFWDAAVDNEKGKVRDKFPCPSCNTVLSKRNMERSWVTYFDASLKKTVKQAKISPVLINYSVSGKRYEKKPDSHDISLIHKIDSIELPNWFPIDKLPDGSNTRQPIASHGLTHTHHFYTKRNLYVMSELYEEAKLRGSHYLDMVVNMLTRANRQSSLHISNYFHGGGGVCKGHLTGTLYIPSLSPEIPALKIFKDRISTLKRGYSKTQGFSNDGILISSQSLSTYPAPSSSVDYIFIDPPFGANINYSEVNYIDESWLKVKTNNIKEAIENSVQGKSLTDYRVIMTECFAELYRILKPGHWMTVEFSNTKAVVWNNIQMALSHAGFIVSNVSTLDKKLGSFKAVTTPTAVKQDLVISAYKPNGGFESRFNSETDENGVWDFIRTHLSYLPIVKKISDELVNVPERDPRILFDQVVAYFVRNMRDVPVSSKEFQDGLLERFSERDGMIFLPEQVVQYDKVRITNSQLRQLNIFVDDEASSIEWLRKLLNDKPKTYQNIHPEFINELSGWKKAELQLELSTLLEQNFIKFDGQGQVPPQIHSYLSTNYKDLRNLPKDDPTLLRKAKDRWYVPNPEREEDLQKWRERSLLKQFEEYKTHTGKKIKLIRIEAVRCGFKKAWQERDYATIISVAEKIPQNLLQEDQKLLMWYDQAQTRSGDST